MHEMVLRMDVKWEQGRENVTLNRQKEINKEIKKSKVVLFVLFLIVKPKLHPNHFVRCFTFLQPCLYTALCVFHHIHSTKLLYFIIFFSLIIKIKIIIIKGGW